jgi:hypothetical protein
LAYNRVRLGWLTVVDLNRTVFQKNNLLFGYYFRPDTVGFLRAEVNGFRQHNFDIKKPATVFDKVTVDLVHKIDNKSKAAVEVQYIIILGFFWSSLASFRRGKSCLSIRI